MHTAFNIDNEDFVCYKNVKLHMFTFHVVAFPPKEVNMKHTDFETIQTDSNTQENFFRAFMSNRRHPGKILLLIYKGNYLTLLKSVFLFLIQMSPTFVLPLVTANIINIATYPGAHNLQELFWNVGIMSLFILQNIVSTYLCTKNRSIAQRRVEFSLRASMARKLQMLSIAFHKEMKSGKIQSKIMRDVQNIEALTNNLLVNGINIVLSLSFAITITLSKSPTIFLFFLITVPCAVIIMKCFTQKLKNSNESYRKEVENASSQVIEMVDLLPITKAHATEETALNRMNRNFSRIANSAHRLDRVNAVFGATYWVVFEMFRLLCLAFTGFLAFKKVIPIGDITLYQSYFATIVGQVSVLISLLPAISTGFDSVRSVGEIMGAMDFEDDKDKPGIENLYGNYEFRDLFFKYPDNAEPVLKGLNLTIQQGETVAFVGESGSGKTTLLNLLIGFYRPTSGSIFIDGQDMTTINLHSYRSHIATVPQTSVLFSGTIRDNITFGLENYTESQLQQAIEIANLTDVIAKLPNGLDTMVGEHGDKLSGGQKQRVAIARAVIRNASVIIFDEATSALDTISEKLIQDSLDKLAKNRTTFIVAHRLSTIRNADKIAVLKDGRCVEYGTWEELMEKKGEFYKFRNLQT